MSNANPVITGLLQLALDALNAEVEKAPEDIARDVLDLISTVAPSVLSEYLTPKDAAVTDAGVNIAEDAKLAVKAMGG